jgi:hypothetical protein
VAIKVQSMKLILQKNIPALSGKSREERAEIIVPLAKTDSKLKSYRNLFVGIFIFTPAFITAFYGSQGTFITTIFASALVVIITSAFLQLFYFNPRLKEILEDKSV